MNSRNLQADWSPQTLKNPANGANPILSVDDHSAASPVKISVLNSWKEIAAYLGRGVRTVQRWEQDSGLPVHRPKGKDRSAVLAIPEELDDWLHTTPVRSNGNGAGNGGSVGPECGRVLLALARDLLEQGERLVKLDQKHRAEAEQLVQAVREIVRGLTLASGAGVAAQPDPATKRHNPAA